MNRSFSLLLASFLLCAFGCGQKTRSPQDTVGRAWEHPDDDTAPRKAPGEREPGPLAEEYEASVHAPPADDTETRESPAVPIASVNGRPLSRERVAQILLDAYGKELVELLIRSELAKGLAEGEGIEVSPADVKEEYDQALRRISAPVLGEEMEFDREQAEQLLDRMLERNLVSKTQFMIKIEHDAYLRRVAERNIQISDDMLAAEHERAYGERVQVRHLQLNTLEQVTEVRAQLDQGVDFELLVGKYSRNEVTAAAGGLLPPFSRHDDAPPLLREAAFSLQTGQVSSAIYENGAYHLIRLERRFPPTAVSAELVEKELRKRVSRRLVEERMRQLAADLWDQAHIEIADPGLRKQMRRQHPNAEISAR